MSRFIVDPSFSELFPQARIGVVVCRGIDNTGQSSPEDLAALERATAAVGEHLPNPEFSQNDVIQTWRRAFSTFPTRKGARSSVEAMLKRASQGKGVGAINHLVDLYNTVSLAYAVPVGGEDLDAVSGDIRLTRAVGGEYFVTLGSEASEPALPGEVVYADDAGAICRSWNWREAVRTMLTEQTTDAVLVVEAVDDARPGVLDQALAALEQSAGTLGGTTRSFVLDRDHPQADLA